MIKMNEEDARTKQDLLFEVSSLNARLSDEIVKNEQLQNNWNELKKYISAEWYCFDNESVEFEVARKIMEKAQELEQVKDEN